ncbi:MAG: flagellar basal body-associated FliL family protein [candidate division Zixibacteria bacterium]|nr:flagellar basal body-associated FliL family protein [candidate division Zixibacteria bacterium]
MPADDEKTTVEVKENAEPEKKKGSSKLILFGGIGLAVVVLGVVLAMFVIKPMMAGSDEGAVDEAQVSNTHEEDAPKKPKTRKPKDGTSEAFVYAIKDIVINPAGTGGSRFLSVSFGFEIESSELAAEFERRELLVRDALITIMSSKTVAQLTDAKQKEIIRYQIKKRLSKLLDTEDLAAVYYTDFVLQ